MREKERVFARELRSAGWSVRAIAKKTRCAKSSVSKWVRDISLTDDQIRQLRFNQDRARALAAKHPNSPRNKWASIRDQIIKKSSGEIRGECSREILRLVGTALYWAEGYNASRNSVIFANTSPAMVKLMMNYFRGICEVPDNKFRGKISIHPHLDIRKAERYWAKVSGIPLKQFNKPLLAVSRASKGKRDTLPVGTFSIIISDVVCCSKIKGWIEGIKKWVISSVG